MSSAHVNQLRALADDLESVARKLKNGTIEPDRAARKMRDIASDMEQLARRWRSDLAEHE